MRCDDGTRGRTRRGGSLLRTRMCVWRALVTESAETCLSDPVPLAVVVVVVVVVVGDEDERDSDRKDEKRGKWGRNGE